MKFERIVGLKKFSELILKYKYAYVVPTEFSSDGKVAPRGSHVKKVVLGYSEDSRCAVVLTNNKYYTGRSYAIPVEFHKISETKIIEVIDTTSGITVGVLSR